MWVILCAAYWVQYSTQDISIADYREHGDIATKYGCSAPQSATIDEILHYRSKDYPQAGVPSLQYIEMMEEHKESQAVKDAMEAAKPGSSKPVEEQPKSEQEATEAPKPAENKSEPVDCKYWFETIKPHVHKLWRKCPGKKAV